MILLIYWIYEMGNHKS